MILTRVFALLFILTFCQSSHADSGTAVLCTTAVVGNNIGKLNCIYNVVDKAVSLWEKFRKEIEESIKSALQITDTIAGRREKGRLLTIEAELNQIIADKHVLIAQLKEHLGDQGSKSLQSEDIKLVVAISRDLDHLFSQLKEEKGPVVAYDPTSYQLLLGSVHMKSLLLREIGCDDYIQLCNTDRRFELTEAELNRLNEIVGRLEKETSEMNKVSLALSSYIKARFNF